MRTDDDRARSRETARRWRDRNPEAARKAARQWKERNPDKVREANRRSRTRIYEPEKSKIWRQRRLAVPGYRERVTRPANDRATAIRRWLDSYKIEQGCIDCGYRKFAVALHFDHVEGRKAFNVCNAKSIDHAKREIAKCVVRCANCHAIKTHRDLQLRKSP